MKEIIKREKFIDIARAFAILFIVMGHTLVHSAHCEIVIKVLYSFHVVLFFIISGYTFKIKENEKIIDFIKNKFIRIMIPYFVWAVLFLIPYMILGENVSDNLGTSSSFNIQQQILNILYGNGNNGALKQNSALWFLPALFTMELVYYFIIKIFGKSYKNDIIILALSVFIGYISNLIAIALPWGINTTLNLGLFFYFGTLTKKYELFRKEKIFKIKYMIIILIIGILAFYFNDRRVSCMSYDYGIFSFMLLSGICLSLVVLYVSYLIKENKILEYIGKNTMGILIFHKLIILIFQTKLGIISKFLKDSNMLLELVISIVVLAITITCSILITEIIKKFIPIIIGEKTKYKLIKHVEN